jgi:pimeloyl-ACP methyl ester carboxylesterase
MRGLISRLEERVIPAAGHWLPQERPLEVNEALVRFLAATRR